MLSTRRSGERVLAMLIAACGMILILPYAVIGPDFHHDGVVLKLALDVIYVRWTPKIGPGAKL